MLYTANVIDYKRIFNKSTSVFIPSD